MSDGPTNLTTYLLNLTVFDGINYGYQDLMVQFKIASTFSSKQGYIVHIPTHHHILPDYFEDLDGEIVSWDWQFFEPVNLDGQDIDRNDLFVELRAHQETPLLLVPERVKTSTSRL